MNQTQASLPQNPWRSPEGIPSAKLPRVLLAAVAFLASCLFLPLWEFEPYSYVTIAFCVVYTAACARSLRGTLPVLLCVLAPMLLSPLLGGALAALILACSAGSFLLTSRARGYLWLLLFPAAFGIAFAVTRDTELSLLAFFSLPALLAMTLATRKNAGRTATVAAATAGLVLSLLVLLAVLVRINAGVLTPDSIRSSVEYVREAIVRTMLEQRDLAFAEMRQQVSAQPAEEQAALNEMLAQLEQHLSEDALRTSVGAVFNLLPALFLIAAMLVSYLAQSLLCRAYFVAGMERVLTREALFLDASLTSAILFEAAFLVQILTPSTLVGAVAANLFLALMPLFLLLGLRGLRQSLAQMPGGGKTFWLLLVVAGLCCNPLLIAYLSALLAAARRILGALREHLRNKLSSMEDDR